MALRNDAICGNITMMFATSRASSRQASKWRLTVDERAPGRAGNTASGLDGATEDDELHAVHDTVRAAADKGRDEAGHSTEHVHGDVDAIRRRTNSVWAWSGRRGRVEDGAANLELSRLAVKHEAVRWCDPDSRRDVCRSFASGRVSATESARPYPILSQHRPLTRRSTAQAPHAVNTHTPTH